MDHVAPDSSVLRVSPCLNGNSPQCRSTARVLLGNVSKFISQQVMGWDSNPDSAAAWPLLLLSAAYSYKHGQEDNSWNPSCSQPFGFWQTGASKAWGKRDFSMLQNYLKTNTESKCFPKEHLPAVLTVPVNHSHTLSFSMHLSATIHLLVSGHSFFLPFKVPSYLGFTRVYYIFVSQLQILSFLYSEAFL